MHLESWIHMLEQEWDLEQGSLGTLRRGAFDPEGMERLIRVLELIEPLQEKSVDRRLVSLLWYISPFLYWHKERFFKQGQDTNELDKTINKIDRLLERILGTP